MSTVERGQVSAVETGHMTAAETSVLSQQETFKKHKVFACLSSRPPGPFERDEGQCHQVPILQQLLTLELRRRTRDEPHRSLENPSEPLSASTVLGNMLWT